MSDEASQILGMAGEGKITSDEAEKLINDLRPPSANAFAFDPKMGLRGMGRGPRSRK